MCSISRVKKKLLNQAKHITGLENPNSPTQLLAWLKDDQGLDIPNLQKKTVQVVLKRSNRKS